MIRGIFIALCGFASGVFGGLGMGGGTTLIPLLTIFFGISQAEAQGLNLLSFVPMAVVALFNHGRNGFVKSGGLAPVIFSGVAFAAAGALLASVIDVGILRRLFGGFLIVLAVIEGLGIIKKRGK